MTDREYKSAYDKVLRNIHERVLKIFETVKLAKKVVKQKGAIRKKNINKLKVYFRYLNTRAVKFQKLIQDVNRLEHVSDDKYYRMMFSSYNDVYNEKRKLYNKKYAELEKICRKIEELDDLFS